MESFAFELLDENGESVQEIHPTESAELHIFTGAPIGRTIPNVIVGPDEAPLIDQFTSRFRVWMNKDGVDYSLGVFIPTSGTPHKSDVGTSWEYQLHDQGFLLTENLTTAYGVSATTLFVDALNDLLTMAGVTGAAISGSSLAAGTHLAWQSGRQIADAAASIAKRCGFTRPWFDRHGDPQVIPQPYLGQHEPVASFGPGTTSTVSGDGIQTPFDLWSIPTEWRVQSSGQVVDFSATYYLPEAHPLSQQRTNRRTRQKVIEVPGLTSDAEAYARAKEEAEREARVYKSASFSAEKDPTLEQYAEIEVEGEAMFLAEVVFPLVPGAMMQATARESLTEAA